MFTIPAVCQRSIIKILNNFDKTFTLIIREISLIEEKRDNLSLENIKIYHCVKNILREAFSENRVIRKALLANASITIRI